VHHPLLDLDQLDMQPGQLLIVVLDFQLAVGSWNFVNSRLPAFFVALMMTSTLLQRAFGRVVNFMPPACS
jgi:hypothetical protein